MLFRKLIQVILVYLWVVHPWYALLHLAGYDSVTTEDLKTFRQWGSKIPGHPENFETQVTTGPLGQGIANAVGLALAEKHLAARFNKPDSEIVDHYTYCILGDGCQMEGIANEACSLAGHWGLGKLIAFYDDKHISIDGDTEIAFTESVDTRFEGLGWHVIWVKNGNNGYDEIRAAIKEAKAVTDKPTLIKVTTTIGFGSPNKANSYAVHGAALGSKEVDATRKNLDWSFEPFHVPEDVKSHWSRHTAEGAALEAEWTAKFAEYEKKYSEDAAELKSIMTGEFPAGWEKALPTYTPEIPADATRNLSQTCLNALAPVLPGLIGGSADLASSNMTLMKMFGDFQKATPEERNVRFGVREHAMGAICNGIALHSPGFVPYCATFFVFTDYMRGAMRISALSEAGVIYVMTHDSIGLGEDGPTHQPIEHLASFRAMPNILMLRPADGNETAGSYKVAVENRKRPSILALSRQKLANLPGTSIEGVAKGGYTISDNSTGNKPDVILCATGSELEIAEKAAGELRKEGKTGLFLLFPGNYIMSRPTNTRSLFFQLPSLLGLGLRQVQLSDGTRLLEAKERLLVLTVSERVRLHQLYTKSLASHQRPLLQQLNQLCRLFSLSFFQLKLICHFGFWISALPNLEVTQEERGLSLRVI
ncbi:hypothetical protein C5167_043087 [Papaver somniferum]|uniref:transketolase n=1 Tax=Papaver somniferum TaxID=3469 RepID=A0A4Y7L5P2_PAPSO|nr:hypothetical protein C5167_043087 [Papaver somniferum]